MKRFILPAMLLFMLCAVTARAQSCDSNTNSDDKVFVTKAQELTQGKNTRLEKLQAIHSFVRTEISQAKTEFG
ncbi:MAG: hypothetical protein WCL44_03835 [bacterium]